MYRWVAPELLPGWYFCGRFPNGVCLGSPSGLRRGRQDSVRERYGKGYPADLLSLPTPCNAEIINGRDYILQTVYLLRVLASKVWGFRVAFLREN